MGGAQSLRQDDELSPDVSAPADAGGDQWAPAKAPSSGVPVASDPPGPEATPAPGPPDARTVNGVGRHGASAASGGAAPAGGARSHDLMADAAADPEVLAVRALAHGEAHLTHASPGFPLGGDFTSSGGPSPGAYAGAPGSLLARFNAIMGGHMPQPAPPQPSSRAGVAAAADLPTLAPVAAPIPPSPGTSAGPGPGPARPSPAELAAVAAAPSTHVGSRHPPAPEPHLAVEGHSHPESGSETGQEGYLHPSHHHDDAAALAAAAAAETASAAASAAFPSLAAEHPSFHAAAGPPPHAAFAGGPGLFPSPFGGMAFGGMAELAALGHVVGDVVGVASLAMSGHSAAHHAYHSYPGDVTAQGPAHAASDSAAGGSSFVGGGSALVDDAHAELEALSAMARAHAGFVAQEAAALATAAAAEASARPAVSVSEPAAAPALEAAASAAASEAGERAFPADLAADPVGVPASPALAPLPAPSRSLTAEQDHHGSGDVASPAPAEPPLVAPDPTLQAPRAFYEPAPVPVAAPHPQPHAHSHHPAPPTAASSPSFSSSSSSSSSSAAAAPAVAVPVAAVLEAWARQVSSAHNREEGHWRGQGERFRLLLGRLHAGRQTSLQLEEALRRSASFVASVATALAQQQPLATAEAGTLGRAAAAQEVLRRTSLRVLLETKDKVLVDSLRRASLLVARTTRVCETVEKAGQTIAAEVKSRRNRLGLAWAVYQQACRERHKVGRDALCLPRAPSNCLACVAFYPPIP